MCASLSNRVAQIRNNASILAMAGQELARGTHQLDERTRAQASQLASASEQVQALGERVRQTAQHAQAAHQVSTRVREAAESSAALMQSAVGQVRQIEMSSHEMGDIIAVIDSIAFQTNILALNAAVEAARAGEQGRGFAVVASEVRALAQRSAASAAQVKRLIAQSAEQVEQGARSIETLGQTLADIVGGVRELSGRVGEMADGSVAQAAGLGTLAEAVQGANALTQRNAAMVADSARAARELGERTEELSRAAQTVRLRQGSADEARRLVERAVALVKRDGLRAAVPRLVDRAGEFFDRDMYIFIFNREGVFTAFGPNPGLHGGHLRQVQGLQWEHLLREGFVRTDAGGGWVDYQTVHPGTGAVNDKVSFVLPLPGDLLVGCGVYKVQGL
ncbi:methyl-accepting chemotaxis protein [Roseateles sp. DXS20W]